MIAQNFFRQGRMDIDELFLRQQRLLARSSQLRLHMADVVQEFKKPLAIADSVQACLQWLYHNPLWPLSTLLVVVVLRPRRVISWGGRAWWAWKAFKRAKMWINARSL